MGSISSMQAPQNQWMNNQGISIGTIGISGLASTSEGSGNRYTAERLNKTVTIPSAGSSYTLTHGGGCSKRHDPDYAPYSSSKGHTGQRSTHSGQRHSILACNQFCRW